MKKYLIRLLALPLLLATFAHAGESEDLIRAKLKTVLPDAQVIQIDAMPVSGFPGGLFQVTLRNYEPVLVTGDGRYVIQGDILEIRNGDLVSVTDQMMAVTRRQELARVKAEDMVVFPATGKLQRVLYVFTDVDCGYCRKFHAQVPELNRRGVEVRYLAFPRGGMASPVAGKLNGVWCSPDRRKAMTEAKRGTQVAPAAAVCKAPVKAQYDLGNQLGVRGTPAVFSDEGLQLGGYVPVEELARSLKLR